jgi:hypothetical protein
MADPWRATRRELLRGAAALATWSWGAAADAARRDEPNGPLRWLPGRAYHVPSELTNQESGYQSIGEGKDGRIYLGAAKYGVNAYLVEFDPVTEKMRAVVDVMAAIGSRATGFAAQAKIHTPVVVGASGRLYFGSKQGYPEAGEKVTDYPGGHPLVHDPAAGSTRVYPVPVPHHGVISHVPDEPRGLSYISTCNDGRPADSTHFLVLDLRRESYRDLGDMARSFAYIQLDHRGRALHLAVEARVARYDPAGERLEMLAMTVAGKRPSAESLLFQNHPLQIGIAPDRKTLYLLPMSENALYVGDLTREDGTLPLRRIAPMLAGGHDGTDCRALDVDRRGRVWATIRDTIPGYGMAHHLCVYDPATGRCRDLGVPAIANPDYVERKDAAGKDKPWHHGLWTTPEGRLIALYHHMAIKAARDGTIYTTIIAPFTLLRLPTSVVAQAEGRGAAG